MPAVPLDYFSSPPRSPTTAPGVAEGHSSTAQTSVILTSPVFSSAAPLAADVSRHPAFQATGIEAENYVTAWIAAERRRLRVRLLLRTCLASGSHTWNLNLRLSGNLGWTVSLLPNDGLTGNPNRQFSRRSGCVLFLRRQGGSRAVVLWSDVFDQLDLPHSEQSNTHLLERVFVARVAILLSQYNVVEAPHQHPAATLLSNESDIIDGPLESSDVAGAPEE